MMYFKFCLEAVKQHRSNSTAATCSSAGWVAHGTCARGWWLVFNACVLMKRAKRIYARVVLIQCREVLSGVLLSDCVLLVTA